MPIRFTGRSVIVETAYGKIIIYNTKRGVIRMALQRRIGRFWRFVSPEPKLLQFLCTKHVEETRGKGFKSKVIEGEMVAVAELEAGVHASVEEVYWWLKHMEEECFSCSICHDVKWESPNCENMCKADWSLMGLEYRPVPPAREAPCYMSFWTGYGLSHCDCEGVRFE